MMTAHTPNDEHDADCLGADDDCHDDDDCRDVDDDCPYPNDEHDNDEYTAGRIFTQQFHGCRFTYDVSLMLFH